MNYLQDAAEYMHAILIANTEKLLLPTHPPCTIGKLKGWAGIINSAPGRHDCGETQRQDEILESIGHRYHTMLSLMLYLITAILGHHTT